jgi:NAD(P)-dependent dehydrogenase (short-subunit alcohol dehydrogenase family)
MKTYLVTGASSGVGLALTKLLAARHQRVIMAIRDEERGIQIMREHPGARLEVAHLDLLDLDSVRALAGLDVDVLVNNAGIAFEPMALTKEHVLAQFGVNHLGHFLLTALLWERLEVVVTVTSTLAKKGRLDLTNLDGSRGYGRMQAYTQSKIANVLFAAELARRAHGKKSVLAHPGVPATAMQQKASGLIGIVARTSSALVGKPPALGAGALLAAAEGDNGALYGPGQKKETPWPTMFDRDGAKMLWERSEALTGRRFAAA